MTEIFLPFIFYFGDIIEEIISLGIVGVLTASILYLIIK